MFVGDGCEISSVISQMARYRDFSWLPDLMFCPFSSQTKQMPKQFHCSRIEHGNVLLHYYMFLLILISKLAAPLWGKTFATLSVPIKSHRGSSVLKYKRNKAGKHGIKTFLTFTGKASPVKATNEEESGRGNKKKSERRIMS